MSDSTYTVLVVDDSATNRSYLKYILEEDGYRIVQAANGETCIAAAKAEKPILILLDVVMPGIDGYETLARLKEDGGTARTPVIMLTSLDDQESKLKAFELGAVDYIVKSSNPLEVRARVRVHVRLALANEELIKARRESIMQIAQAQRSLLLRPRDLPAARFAVYYRSLHEAGGDFYDVVPVSDDIHFYLIADVAGHDLGTSYVTPAVKVLLKQFATPAYSVEETMALMNGILSRTVCADNYLTAFALRLNRRSRKAVFLAAGHPAALYLPVKGEPRFIECENPLIGMIEESTYHSETMDAEPGDRFVLYTDGLVECGPAPTVWADSKASLLTIADKLRALPLDEYAEAIVLALGADKAKDDVAVLVVEV
ncbi:MAG: fused response regulator/phosphatase [Spirochaetaceae bacterium]|nr:fused response regulator/phosphatase [Spirochaetaceae bacterium]